jgi:hypothetical protein
VSGSDAWDIACAPWIAARREELSYEENVWGPANEENSGNALDAIERQMDQLLERRLGTETAIFAVPAANARQLATKILIAFDNGRDAGAYLPAILADCRRFADDALTRGEYSPEDSLAERWIGGAHRALLNERNALAASANAASEGFKQDLATSRSLAAENALMRLPAATDDDVIARLVLIAQLSPEGSEPNPEFCATVVREAQAHFGMGALDADTVAPEVDHD